MRKFKTISIVSIAVSLCGVSNLAIAQTMVQPTIKNQSVMQSSGEKPVQFVNANYIKPTVKRKVRRVVEPLPAQAVQVKPSINSNLGRVIFSDTAGKKSARKFVYNNIAQRTQTPVYFGDVARNAR